MTVRTFEVSHEGTHYPTNRQLRDALNAALKDDGVRVDGDVDYFLVENVSGGVSKVRATFEASETKPPVKPEAKTDKTKTVGG